MKINLGVVIYGNTEQYAVNLQQIDFWWKELVGFNLSTYDFNQDGAIKLLDDWQAKKIDLVVKNAYGRANEARIESWLELNQIPFIGSNSSSTLIGTNKYLSKQLFSAANIKTPKFLFVNRLLWLERKEECLEEIQKSVGFPFMLKECGGTDSRGIYKIKSKDDFRERAEVLLVDGLNFIAEEYISTKLEITCLVGGVKDLVVYDPVGCEYLGTPEEAAKKKDKLDVAYKMPPNIGKKNVKLIKDWSLLAHQVLGCSGFSRADFLYNGKNVYIIEVDVHPGFRANSSSTLSIEQAGKDLNSFFVDLCKEIL
jgi:D-alanine-D-alanine ligase